MTLASNAKRSTGARKFLLHSGIMPEEQAEATRFLVNNPRSALWMMPGLGKTLATLAAIDLLCLPRILVIAPLRCCSLVWPEEVEKWLPEYDCTQVKGMPKKRTEILRRLRGHNQILTLNYELIPWLVDNHPEVFHQVNMIVFDEASKLKSWKTSRFKKLKKPIFETPRVVELTGTPAPNGLLGIWSQVFLLDRGERLGKYITHYKQRYFDQDYLGYTFTPRDPERIHKRVEGLVYSLRNMEYRDMVRPVAIKVDATTSTYTEMAAEGLVNISTREIVATSRAVQGLKMRQIINGFIYDEEGCPHDIHDKKIEAVKDLVDEMAGQPLIIFYEFTHDLTRLRKALPQAKVFINSLVKDWNAGKVEVMLMSPWSAGHGLNLQAGGNRVCWFNPPFDLEIHEQANARVARRGQTGTEVLAYYIVGKGSIDEYVLEVLKDKDATQDDLMRALEMECKGELQ